MSNPTPATTASSNASTTASNPKVELGLLEEDDEFEEFETEDWNETEKDVENGGNNEQNLWEDNWDDDNVEDDFTLQLRNELEKRGQKLEI
jgi:26 proteasome complex subunit DSS1